MIGVKMAPPGFAVNGAPRYFFNLLLLFVLLKCSFEASLYFRNRISHEMGFFDNTCDDEITSEVRPT